MTESRNSRDNTISILFLADSRTYHTRRWLRFFADRGFRVLLYDALSRPEPMEGVKIVEPGHQDDPRSPYPERLARILVDLGARIHELRPDILHAHFLVNWGWWGAFSGFHPLVTTVWGSDINIGTRHSDFHRRANRISLRRSDFISGSSAQLIDQTAALKGDRRKCRVVHWGIDVTLFRPGLSTAEFRRKYDLGDGPIILSPRNLLPNFNIDVILKAFKLISGRFPAVTLLIKSYRGLDPDYKRMVLDSIDKLELRPRIRFLGDLQNEEMPLLYNSAALTVSVPDHDGGSCSVLESMACGTATIASRIGSMAEWIVDEENGYLVDQHSPEELAARMETVLNLPESDGLAESARAVVMERGNVEVEWSRMADDYVRLAGVRPVASKSYPELERVNRQIAAARAHIAGGDTQAAYEVYLALIEGLYRDEPERLPPCREGRK